MTTALIAPSTETKLQTSSSLNFYCYVTLSETEQIILNVEETEWKTINNKYTQVPTGEIKKYRLETLIYAGYGDGGRNNKGTGVFLDRIVVRGFRKDGGLKFRDTSLYGQAPIMDKILPQIPDSYHDYARQEFAKEAIKLQEQLTILTNMGVTV